NISLPLPPRSVPMRPFFPSIPFFPHFPVVAVALLGTIFVAFDSARGEVLCDGLPDGGRLFCHVACCIRQQGNRQSYYCCGGNDDGTLPSELYREGGRQPLVYRADQRPDRYSSSS
uniref:Secreted protein n=1 Tax=Globodera pallida TaxID=36090 RepID=A0A183CTF3_GLOPA